MQVLCTIKSKQRCPPTSIGIQLLASQVIMNPVVKTMNLALKAAMLMRIKVSILKLSMPKHHHINSKSCLKLPLSLSSKAKMLFFICVNGGYHVWNVLMTTLQKMQTQQQSKIFVETKEHEELTELANHQNNVKKLMFSSANIDWRNGDVNNVKIATFSKGYQSIVDSTPDPSCKRWRWQAWVSTWLSHVIICLPRQICENACQW